MPSDEDLRQGFRLGEWQVWPLRGVLVRGNQEERPEPLVFGVLLALAKRDGDLVTRDELIDELWDGRPTSDEPINRCLSQLRRHLGDQARPHEYVETLTRRGYRLLKPVELSTPGSGSDAGETAPAAPNRRRWVAGAAAVALGIGWLAWELIPPPPFESIGVLPFDNATLDPADDYLVSGFKDELVHTLANIPDFKVKNSHVSRGNRKVVDVARDLGVDAVLSGRAHRDGDALRIFYTLEDGRSGDVIATGEIDGAVSDVFGLQEDVARLVRNDLLPRSERRLITRTRPANSDAYDRYMRGLYAFDRRQDTASSLEEAIGLFEDTIRLDDDFGPAYVVLAAAYALLPIYRDVPPDEANRLAIETVSRGADADRSVRAAANAVYGYVYHQQKDWLRSEQAYVAATSADIVDPNAFNWYSRMLASVGRLEASLEQARVALELDPTSAIFNSRVAVAYLWIGDTDRALEYFERAGRYGATGSTHFMGYALCLFRQDRFEQAYAVSRQAAEVAGGSSEWIDAFFAGIDDPQRVPEALAAVAAAGADGEISKQVEFIARTLLGDVDGAMQVAWLLEQPGEAFEMDLLFIPEVEALRDHPEFPELLDAVGISEYWTVKGCTWTPSGARCGR